jgi:hypothetical protein
MGDQRGEHADVAADAGERRTIANDGEISRNYVRFHQQWCPRTECALTTRLTVNVN